MKKKQGKSLFFSIGKTVIRFQLREDAVRRWPCAIAPV